MQQMTVRMPDELAGHIEDLASLETGKGARNTVLVRLLQLGLQCEWDTIEEEQRKGTQSSAKT